MTKANSNPASILRLMVLTGFRNMVSKMNFMIFLLFINSQTEVAKEEKGRGRKAYVIIDYNAENIMN